MKASILIVDDETAFLESVTRLLRLNGYTDIVAIEDPRKVESLLDDHDFDVALLDITMPFMDGIDVLKIVKEKSPQTECVMLTANDDMQTVIKTVKLGAYDYIIKPIKPDTLKHTLEKALEHKYLIDSLLLKSETAAEKTLKNPEAFASFDTCNNKMLAMLREAELHAQSTIPILVTGETGVGKELMARAIHMASNRSEAAFVPVNMLSLSPTLFESEFFGHTRGAFTGADKDKTGYMSQAKGGTLFLDEIGDLSMELQGKLLRILQEGEFTPVGSTKAEKANVRFVAATNQNLEKQVQQKKFRKDLFYRLQFAHLHIQPLKERLEDIPLLSARILSKTHRENVSISEEALNILHSYTWPGNIRELRGVLESATNLAEEGTIKPKHLRIDLRQLKTNKNAHNNKKSETRMEALAEVEKRHILAVYKATNNKSETARILEIGLQTLHRKLKSYQAD